MDKIGGICSECGAIDIYVADNATTRERVWAVRRNIDEALRLEAGDPAVLVGLADTGVALAHPELRERVRAGFDSVDLDPATVGGVTLVGDFRRAGERPALEAVIPPRPPKSASSPALAAGTRVLVDLGPNSAADGEDRRVGPRESAHAHTMRERPVRQSAGVALAPGESAVLTCGDERHGRVGILM